APEDPFAVPYTQEEVDAVLAEFEGKCMDMPAVHASGDAVLLKAVETIHNITFNAALRPMVTRFVRLNAVLRERCRNSACVFLTMPIPRPDKPDMQYLAMLDI
ncbi:hypothetical protein KIPB_014921, partial [Kipferlia bialata]